MKLEAEPEKAGPAPKLTADILGPVEKLTAEMFPDVPVVPVQSSCPALIPDS